MEKTTRFSRVAVNAMSAVSVLAVFLLIIGSGFLKLGVAEAAGPAADNPGIQRAMEVQNRNSQKLMKIPGVVGHGVGVSKTGEPIIRIFLERAGVRGLPGVLEGVPTRTKVTGRIVAYVDPTDWFPRPVPTGVSVGHPDITAGTIGSRVTGDLDGDGTAEVYILSNNHVLANSNKAKAGDEALQPGPYDGGLDPADSIGTLHSFVPILFDGSANTMDAAIALTSISELATATPGIAGVDGYGTPSSTPVSASPGQLVQKYGRTTGWTHGVVDTINTAVNVCYQSQGPVRCKLLALFVGQIAITPAAFSTGGDSGSLIVSEDGKHPVGLLFAGGGDYTFANPIAPVLQEFGVEIDTGQPEPPRTDVALAGVSAPATAVQGAMVGVDVTVQNVGNQPVGTFNVMLTDATDNVSIGTLTVLGLASGDSTLLTFPWNTSGASVGAHTLSASHDLADDDAGNDAASTQISIETAFTDVAVASVNAPASAMQGDVVAVIVTVLNTGNQDVAGFDVMLTDTTESVSIDTQAVPALAAGASASLTFSWDTAAALPGAHTLEADHNLGDEDPANDAGSAIVTVHEPSAIVLTATGYKLKGRHHIELVWTGATSATVDVWRDGALVTTTDNDGAYTDNTGNVGGGSYTYKVCESGGDVCSNEAIVTF